MWEAQLYRECGVDGVMVENMHDIPYLRGAVGPEVTACMARVCSEVRQAIGGIPLGVQVLAGECASCPSLSSPSSISFPSSIHPFSLHSFIHPSLHPSIHPPTLPLPNYTHPHSLPPSLPLLNCRSQQGGPSSGSSVQCRLHQSRRICVLTRS